LLAPVVAHGVGNFIEVSLLICLKTLWFRGDFRSDLPRERLLPDFDDRWDDTAVSGVAANDSCIQESPSHR
jgi:hypothetical protein